MNLSLFKIVVYHNQLLLLYVSNIKGDFKGLKRFSINSSKRLVLLVFSVACLLWYLLLFLSSFVVSSYGLCDSLDTFAIMYKRTNKGNKDVDT